MTGDKIRMTEADGRSLTGIIVDVDDATWLPSPSRDHGYLYKITIEHRPQWPSMANRREYLHGTDERWYNLHDNPVTYELLEPAAAPARTAAAMPALPALKLVKR